MILKKLIGSKEFYKKVFIITMPILVQQVITNFVSLIDNIMVGQIGTEQMSGVAIVNQLLFVFNICIFGGISGAGIFTAQFYGKGDSKGVRDTFRAKLLIVAAIAAIALGAFCFFDDELISLFLHQGEDNLDLDATLAFGKEYMLVMLLQIPLFAITQAYAGTLRETGNTVLPMSAGIVAVAANAVLDYVFIFGKLGFPQMGVRGAAVATVIARFLETMLIVLVAHLRTKKYGFVKGLYRSFKIPVTLVKDIAVKGFPLMLNEVMWSLGMAMLTQLYSQRGLEVVSAHNISSTVSNLFYCAFFAFGSSISIIVGQLLGAGELERAKDENRKIIFATVVICVIIGAVMGVLSPFIPKMYETTDTVKHIATLLLLISSVMMPFSGFVHTAYFTLRCGGKTFVTFLFDSVYIWVICVPAAFVLVRFTALSIVVVYGIIQGFEIIKCVVGYVLVKKGVWINNLVK